STKDLTDQVTWASSNTAIATIDSAGLATGVTAGTSKISAMLGGITGSTTLSVGTTQLPTITGEQIGLTFLAHNKKGQPVGKPVIRVVLDFKGGIPMNPATASNVRNYQVAWTTTKKVKKHVVTVLHPVGVRATYNAVTNSVTLTV